MSPNTARLTDARSARQHRCHPAGTRRAKPHRSCGEKMETVLGCSVLQVPPAHLHRKG
jgi:hypothetical protein